MNWASASTSVLIIVLPSRYKQRSATSPSWLRLCRTREDLNGAVR